MLKNNKNLLLNISLLWILWGIWVTNITEDFLLSGIIISTVFLFWFVLCLHIKSYIFSVLFFVVCFVAWSYFTAYSQSTISQNSDFVTRYTGLYLPASWEVKKLYKRSDFYDEYIISLREIDEQKVPENIFHILRIPKNFSLVPGQVISYQWKIYPLEDFDGFSYKKYMLASRIYYSTSAQSFETHIPAPQDWKYFFYTSRQKLLAQIASLFPEEEAIFLWGILFWARENIPQDLKEDFNNSGLTHFIAVSGFNITLCVIFVTFLFGFLPAWARVITVTLTITAFSVFVWLWAPVVRAAIMGILGYIFLQSGNNAKNITILLFAAVCMSLYSPLALNYDVSLHLSFLAVIGIMYTQDFFQKIFYFVPQTFAIREALVLTLAALTFALPIMIFQFGQVSLLAPFSNIAVTWTIPLAMIGGAVTLIVDSFSSTLWTGLWFITWILLHYDIMMVRFFGNLEFALIEFDFWPYAIYLQMLYFIALSCLVYYFRSRKSE